MIDVGQDALGRWAFMILAPRSGHVIASDWDFETEGDAYRAGLDALDTILRVARELDSRPEAARALTHSGRLLSGGDRGG